LWFSRIPGPFLPVDWAKLLAFYWTNIIFPICIIAMLYGALIWSHAEICSFTVEYRAMRRAKEDADQAVFNAAFVFLRSRPTEAAAALKVPLSGRPSEELRN
jgi:hypothetical protein